MAHRLKSVETTTQVINRYFKYICVDYKSMMQLGKSLGILRHCPFVLGSLCFTPLHGASKKHVSWIALHNVQDITAHQKATHFNIDSRHELLLNIHYKKALRLIEQTKLLSECQQKMTTEWLRLMHHHSYHNNRPNVVTRYNTNSHFSKPLPLLSSWLNTQSFLQARTILKDMLKESDPLLDYLHPETEADKDDDINDVE